MALVDRRDTIVIEFDDFCKILESLTNQDGSSISDDQPLSIIVQHKNQTIDLSEDVQLQNIKGFDCELNPPPPTEFCEDPKALNFGKKGECTYGPPTIESARFTVSNPSEISFDDDSDIKFTLIPRTVDGERFTIKKSEIGFNTSVNNTETLIGSDFTINEVDGNIEYTFKKPKYIDESKQASVTLRFTDNIASKNKTVQSTTTLLAKTTPPVEVCLDPDALNYNEEGDCIYPKKEEFCLDCILQGIETSLREGVDEIDVTTDREETVPITEANRYLKYSLIDNLGNYNPILNWVRGGNLQQVESEIDVLDSIVVKLESPLPINVTRIDLTDIYKTEYLPLEIDIDLSEDVEEAELRYLRPNFSADIEINKVNEFNDYENYESITLNQNTSVQEQIVDYYLQRDKNVISLNTDFTNFDNFVKFSSAEERLNNFFYKTQLIETYTSQSASVALTGTSIYKTKELEKLSDSIRTTKNSFDDYEYFLYNDSGSFYSSSYVSSSDAIYASWPKQSDNSLYPTTSSIVVSWFDSFTDVAKDFDNLNRDSFRNNTPEFIREDKNSEEYVLFVDMVGHLMDEVYIHSKELSNLYDWNLDKTKGLSEDLSIVLLNMFADNLDTSFAEKSIWEYILGLSSDGTNISTDTNYSFKKQQKETLRRLLTNLPHLLKHKGTRRSIRGLINSYGIPESTLKIQEYGTFQTPNGTQVEEFTQETDYKLLINSSTDSRIELTDSSLDGIKAVEFNIQWDGTRSSSPIFRGVDTDTGGDFNIILEPTQSGNFGMVVLQIDDTSNTFEVSSSVLPIYNGLFTNILVQQVQSGSYELYVNQYDVIDNEFDYQIYTTGSVSTAISSSIDNVFNDTDKIVFGYSSSDNLTFSGYLDELRVWKSTLTQDNFNTHTKYPKSITLNNALDIPTSLVVRADLESQFSSNIVGTPGSLPNLVFNPTYSTTLDVYDVSSSDYKTFTRDVRVVTPNVGNDKLGNNKVRFGLNQTLSGNVLTPSNLSSEYKSNEIITDEILDSNELVVGFSPTDILNQIIIQHFGSTDLVDEYGDPTEQYSDTYQSLSTLVENFFANISENYKTKFFIDYIRNFDKTLFNNVKKFVPERVSLTTGIFIEPHLLDRSKAKRLAKSQSEDQTKQGGNVVSSTTPVSEYLTKIGEPISVYDSSERLIGDSFGIPLSENGEANLIISQDEIGAYLNQNTLIIVLKGGFEEDIINYIKPDENMLVRVQNNYGEVFLFEFRKYGGNEFLSQIQSYENQISSIPAEDRNSNNKTYVDIVRNYDELYSLYNKVFLIKHPYTGTKPGIAATLEDLPSLFKSINLKGEGTNITTTSNKGGITSSNDSLGSGDSAIITTTITSTITRVTDPDGDIKLTVE